MTILGMRTWIKKHTVLIIVLFILLVIGLLASYATIGSSGARNNNVSVDVQQQLQVYEEQIAAARTELEAAPNGYSENNSLANLLKEYGNILYTNSQAEEGTVAFEEAATLYHTAYDNVPEKLNNYGRAQILVNAALCYFMVGNTEAADQDYQAAVELAPEEYNIIASYAQYLLYTNRMEEAKTVLTDYKAGLPAGDENIAAVDELLAAIDEVIAQQNADTETGEDTTGNEEQADTNAANADQTETAE